MTIENDDPAYDSLMSSRNKHADSRLKDCGYKKGGAVKEMKKVADKEIHKHEKHDHPGKKLTKLKKGGMAEGGHSKSSIGKYARGGATKKKSGTTVNVVIAGGGNQQPQKIPVPVPSGGPPRPPMAPQGGAPMPPPGGMPPRPGMAPPQGGMPMRPGMKRGGSVKMGHHYDAGAGGGEGRIEKAKEYGPKARAKGGKC